MGKPGKREMKHSKAINGTKHKLKAKKYVFNCKWVVPITSSRGGKWGTNRVKGKEEARKKLLKKKLRKMKVDELMKRDIILELKETKPWRNFGNLVKSYLSNSLHVMNQMTDNQMISFTIWRIRSSVIFLPTFATLLRKYLKVALHF